MDIVSYILSKNAVKHVEADVEEVKEEVAEIEEELDKKVNKDELGSSAYLDVPVMGDALPNEVVIGDDSRLTNSRDPNPHTHTVSDISDFPSLGTAAEKDWSNTYDPTSEDLVTGKVIGDALETLPHPMVFKGSLGEGGTISQLPAAVSANEGFTYKVITDGTYAGCVAHVGDSFTSDGSVWVHFPSGDEPGGTVMSVKIQGSGAIAVDDESAITTSGVRTISHNDSGVSAGTYTSVTVDGKGHVTAGSNPDISYNDLIDKPTLGTAAALDVPASGNASSSQVVKGDDSRLTDARTPVSHTHALSEITDAGTAAALDVPTVGDASSTEVVLGSDTRLTDARIPVSHTHTLSEVTDAGTAAALNVAVTGDASTSEVVKGDDSRLTDARNAADVYAWAKEENKPNYTKSEVGLGNVDNTSDADKPISTATQTALDNKVDKVDGKGLSTNDYTTTEKNKLAGIESGAEANVQADWDEDDNTSDAFINNKPVSMPASDVYPWAKEATKPSYTASEVGLGNVDNTADLDKPISTATQSALDDKVDKVSGKGLSTNDYTTAEKDKLSGIAAGAEVNVQSNWEQSSSSADDYIKNKPANLVQDASYVHTDNNYTTTEKDKLNGIETGAQVNVQSDWSVTDSTSDAFIKNKPNIPAAQVNADWTASSGVAEILNKPTLGTAAALNVASTGDASSAEVVKGNDSRLTDSRTPKSHTHTKSEITDFPTLGTAAAKDVPASGNASASQVVMGNDTRLTDTTYTVATGDSNGQIKVTPSSGNAYNVDVKGLAGGAYKAVDTTVTSGSSNLITSGAVWTAIDNLPEPMVFKGSLGTGGTITALPVNGSANIGDTYKVITAGTYAGQAAKVGDLFTCLTKTSSANTWEYFPSGDEPSGTVTSVKISATSPIAIDSDAAITTSGTRTISHANSGATAGSYGDSSTQTPGYEGTFKVPYVTVNATGHVTGISEHTVKIPALGTTSSTAAAGNHTHSLSIATSTGTNAITLAASTKYQLTAGGSTYIFTTPPNTTYSSKTAASGGTDVSLVTTGEKYT